MRRYNAPSHVALVYVLAGVAWIAASDWLLLLLSPEHLRVGQAVKGVAFVVLSGILIYFLVRREMRRRARVEAEREELQRRLAGSQRLEAIGRLTGGIAHDFNNLLTAISGNLDSYIEDLAGYAPPAPVPVELAEAASAARRAEDLTRQLLAFGRRQHLRPQPLDLNDVIRDMSQLLHRLIGDRITIQSSLEDQLWVMSGDRGPLQQVVMNLALNARDAMADGGRLALETRNARLSEAEAREQFDFPILPGDYVRLRVEDTGTGMDAVTRERIYEPFFTTKDKHVGTGLGMSTVYGIVKQSGGYIDLESRPGEGTRFDLYFPRRKDASPPTGTPRLDIGAGTSETIAMVDADAGGVADEDVAAGISARSVGDGQSGEKTVERPGLGTVLVVEDEPAVRSIIIRTLERRGFSTLECACGEEALELLQSSTATSIDLLLTDAVMPGMGGPQLIERSRAMRPALPVLLMSGYSEEEFASGEAYLPKPFTPDGLVARVRDALATRRGTG